DSHIIKDLFNLDDEAIRRLEQFVALLKEWNQKVNLISRKDIDNIWVHHIAHSLAPIKFLDWTKFSDIADLGTGGGLPGIPLAIVFPQKKFILIDSRKKKIQVLEDIVKNLGLSNVRLVWSRAEDLSLTVDLVCVRAVSNPKNILKWTKNWQGKTDSLHYLFYRGIETIEETLNLPIECTHYDLSQYLPFDYFRGKIVSYCIRKKSGS
ncbi:MAG: 16S rRNA (guanine(527)-N(7))-methyltransferase RsmG, partial [Chlorobi bacterium]|nr:16S rRNA (guanine(527)-N(7))-methyltransferase RsmG [Chlorobiota bacterium]